MLASLPAVLPDCLVLDLHMRGLDGFDVLATFAARQIATPVVVITANDEPDTEERVRSLGAVAYLRKPVDEALLLSAIAAAISGQESKVTPTQRQVDEGPNPLATTG